MSYSTLTIPQLTSKLTPLKGLAAAHGKLIYYYFVLPLKTALTDADLFTAASNLLPTNHGLPPYLDVEATTALLSFAKAQATQLTTVVNINIYQLNYHTVENINEPAFLGPYVHAQETKLLKWVREDLENMLVLFQRVKYHDAVALRAKPQIKVYLQGGFGNVLQLVPILLQFGEG
jgi:hypothetical protein